MPAELIPIINNVSWGRYLTFLGTALISMFAGAQVVHLMYRPLDDLETLVQMEVDKRLLEKNNIQSLTNKQ